MSKAVTLAALVLVTECADTLVPSRELQALWATHSELRGHSVALAAADRRAARELLAQVGWWLVGAYRVSVEVTDLSAEPGPPPRGALVSEEVARLEAGSRIGALVLSFLVAQDVAVSAASIS